MENKEFKHTPGPWEYSLGHIHPEKVIESLYGFSINPPKAAEKICPIAGIGVYQPKPAINQSWPIKEKTPEGYFYSAEEAIANAKLIAAAPELLESCLEALEIMGRYNIDDDGDQVYQRIQDAIKKATE